MKVGNLVLKGYFDYDHQNPPEGYITEQSPEMQEININGAIRAAEGALAGATAAGAYGAVIGGGTGAASGIIEGDVNKILKEEENETSNH